MCWWGSPTAPSPRPRRSGATRGGGDNGPGGRAVTFERGKDEGRRAKNKEMPISVTPPDDEGPTEGRTMTIALQATHFTVRNERGRARAPHLHAARQPRGRDGAGAPDRDRPGRRRAGDRRHAGGERAAAQRGVCGRREDRGAGRLRHRGHRRRDRRQPDARHRACGQAPRRGLRLGLGHGDAALRARGAGGRRRRRRGTGDRQRPGAQRGDGARRGRHRRGAGVRRKPGHRIARHRGGPRRRRHLGRGRERRGRRHVRGARDGRHRSGDADASRTGRRRHLCDPLRERHGDRHPHLRGYAGGRGGARPDRDRRRRLARAEPGRHREHRRAGCGHRPPGGGTRGLRRARAPEHRGERRRSARGRGARVPPRAVGGVGDAGERRLRDRRWYGARKAPTTCPCRGRCASRRARR